MGVFDSNRKLSILLIGFFVEFLFWGIYYSFTMFYSVLVTDFNSSYGFIGFVGTAAGSLGYILSQPAASLVMMTSYGLVVFLMGIVFFLAYFSTSFDQEPFELVFTYAILFGASAGLNAMIFNYFVDNMEGDHSSCMSITTAATGFGVMFFGCLSAYLMISTDVSWRVVFRYLSGCGFLMMISAFGFNYLDISKNTKHEDHAAPHHSESEAAAASDVELPRTQSESDRLLPAEEPSLRSPTAVAADKCGWELLFSGDIRPKNLAISNCLIMFTSIYPIKLSVTYGLAITSENSIYYYMIIAVGLGTVMSRMVVMLEHLLQISFSGLYQMKIYCIGCVMMMVILASYEPSQVSVLGACFGIGFYAIFQGALITLIVLRNIEVLGAVNHVYNLNLQFFMIGATVPFGSYICGAIYDNTGSFQYVYITVAVFFSTAVIVDDFLFPQASFAKMLGYRPEKALL